MNSILAPIITSSIVLIFLMLAGIKSDFVWWYYLILSVIIAVISFGMWGVMLTTTTVWLPVALTFAIPIIGFAITWFLGMFSLDGMYIAGIAAFIISLFSIIINWVNWGILRIWY